MGTSSGDTWHYNILFTATLLTRIVGNRSKYPKNASSKDKQVLVVVLVAQRWASSVQDIPNTNIRAETVDVDVSVESKRPTRDVVSVDTAHAVRVIVLPDTEVAVDEGVVQPEYWVTGGTVHVRHDSTDTVVTPGVGTKLRARSHTSKVAVRVALVHVGGVYVGSLGAVTVTRETMLLIARAGSDVDGKVGERLQSGVSY